MKFFDLHVHSAFSGGESSLEELARTAKLLGYSGICFVFYYQDETQKDILVAEIERIKKEVGIDIYLGFEARDVKELKYLAKKRRSFDLLLARGGEMEMNRVACETPEVDILTHPEYQRNDSGLDHISVRFAAKNDVAIEINFREILLSSRVSRAKILANIAKNVQLAKKYKAKIIICSGAVSHWELKDPFCLASFATLLGLELKEGKRAISETPKEIIEKIKERKDENWIMPGVRRVE
ncbi:MAG: RNase P subunit p30 family protein [Candidatus Aenigmatarchaeota archaeon]